MNEKSDFTGSCRGLSVWYGRNESSLEPPKGRPQKYYAVNVKKTSMVVSFYSKFESRLLVLTVVMLIAVLFAVSAAKGATPKPADLTVVGDGTNVWKMQSSDGAGSFSAVEWGLPGDVRVPADYDGDGIKDIAVWRPSNGNWYVLRSSDGMPRTAMYSITNFNGWRRKDMSLFIRTHAAQRVMARSSATSFNIIIPATIIRT